MGEDRTTCVEKRGTPHEGVVVPCRHRHSSVISSSCSEDAESESTSAGYPPSPDAGEERDEELEYGPGIVNKLRTRFLSISLKQTRGSNMRRSCSMENLLDQDRPSSGASEVTLSTLALRKPVWGNLKRAKSMDTLLMEMTPDPSKPKIVKGGLTRLVPTICDEELPKPDTVKTYKRMFEPAESRRGSYGRRPPVLRASAKSTAAAKTNGVMTTSSTPSAKVTAAKGKYNSAKQPPAKAQQINNTETTMTNGLKKPVMNGEQQQQTKTNGCHVVKATPVKVHNGVNGNIINNVRNNINNNNKDVEKNFNNSINRLLNGTTKKEVHFSPKADVIINGKQHNDVAMKKIENAKPLVKSALVNGVETLNSKPKVPPNRPNLRSPRPLLKIDEVKQNGKVASLPKLLKPTPVVNGFKKPDVEVDSKCNKPPELNGKIDSPTEKNILNGDHLKPMEKKILNGHLKPEKISNEMKEVVEEKVEDVVEVKTIPADSNKLPKAEVKPPPPPQQEPHTTKLPKPLVESPLKVESPSKSSPEPPPTIVKKTVPEIQPKENDVVKKLDKPDRKQQHKPVPEILPKEVGVVKKLDKPDRKQQQHKTVPEILPKENDVVKKLDKPDGKQQQHVEVVAAKPAKKAPSSGSTSMVFDFRGKDVVSHVAVLPAPFGCKPSPPKKREGALSDEEDDDYVDYSVPPPSGVVFEGENVKVGRGSILSTRNKELKIKFDDDVDSNTFVYPSESSLLEDPERSLSPPLNGDSETIPNGQHPPKLKANTVIGNSSAGGGLSTYTPSVLRTMENFAPGMFRSSPTTEAEVEKKRGAVEDGEEENTLEVLKPADPDRIATWSISAGTSDLLF